MSNGAVASALASGANVVDSPARLNFRAAPTDFLPLEAEAFAFPPPPIVGVGMSGGLEAQLQDFAGRSPQDLAAAGPARAGLHANQDPALANVFSTYAANVPQLFVDIDRDKAEALGAPVAEIFSVLQSSLGSSCVTSSTARRSWDLVRTPVQG